MYLDEEGSINISCFDPVRREIAKVSLEKLIRDGRIQPARIEGIVEKTTEEIKRITQKTGHDLCYQVKIHNLPVDIVEMLGKFKYRYSYGQNLINHTLEVVKIGVALAQEVGGISSPTVLEGITPTTPTAGLTDTAAMSEIGGYAGTPTDLASITQNTGQFSATQPQELS